jgi:tripartite ATP-independent transporter DctP family solute receptor
MKGGSKMDQARKNRGLSRRSVLGVGIGASLGIGLAAVRTSAFAADAVTMRLGSDSPIGDSHSAGPVKFKELVEAKTDGRVKITIFPNAQLGDNAAMNNAVKAGTLDGNYSDVGIFSSAVPSIDVVSLPFLFPKTEDAIAAFYGKLGDVLRPKVEAAFAGKILGWGTDGVRNMWNNRHPIKTVDDVKGLKMRVQASQVHKDTYAALGALPTPVAFNELYTALQTHVVDGADNGIVDMLSFKFYQVTKYLTMTRHVPVLDAFLVSDKFLAKLSPADIDVVREAGKAACEHQVKVTLDVEENGLKKLKEKGIEVIEDVDRKPFVDKMTSVYATAMKKIGDPKLLDLARDYG